MVKGDTKRRSFRPGFLMLYYPEAFCDENREERGGAKPQEKRGHIRDRRAHTLQKNKDTIYHVFDGHVEEVE
jgi:hypothetical protein